MSVVIHELPCRPDAETMAHFTKMLFANSGMNGRIEVGWTDIHEPYDLTHAVSYDLADLDEVARKAVSLNTTQNRNVYISGGLRREDFDPKRRAKDSDVIACVAFWADFDREGAYDTALAKLEKLGLKPTIAVITGEVPHKRGQLWWVLEEPMYDLALHRRIQSAIVTAFNGDPAVVNPSRVMRFGGSVAWPLKAGRILEMTQVDTHPVFYGPEAFMSRIEVEEPPKSSYDFVDDKAASRHELETLIKAAHEPNQWHNNAVKATAHLLGRGTPPSVVLDILTPRLQMPGYTFARTHAELKTMVDGAVAKGWYREQVDIAPAPQADPNQRHLLTIADMLNLPAPEWLIKDFIPDRGQSALYSEPGKFKSFVALDMSLSIACGIPWHGHEVKQTNVLYICAEGQHAFGIRILGWLNARNEGHHTDAFRILPVPVNFLNPANAGLLAEVIEQEMGGAGLIVVDTVARNFGTGDENSTKDMNSYIASIGKLATKAHVMNIHHAGKDGTKNERGSSVFRAAMDASLKLVREDGSDLVTILTRKQKDAPEAKPLVLRVPQIEVTHPITGEIFTSRVPTPPGPDVIYDTGEGDPDKFTKVERLCVEELRRLGRTSCSALAAAVGRDRENVRKTLKGLVKRGSLTLDSSGFYAVKNTAYENNDL